MKYQILFLMLLFLGCSAQEVDQPEEDLPTTTQPRIVVFGSTSCGHCQQAIPVFKEQVYDEYKDDIDIFVNVLDEKRFDVDVPQGYKPELTFKSLTGESCGYVPSWVILDSSGDAVLQSCGNEKTIDDMINVIEVIK